ncbi:MAG: glycerate kinase [Chloroflexi bacterium]|nr:glycerate kinase [Chloroflexota bacterium]
MDLTRWNAHSLASAPWGGQVARILEAALQAVDPAEAVRRQLSCSGSALKVGSVSLDLRRFRRVRVVGAGKAGAPMTRAVVEIMGPLVTDGIVIVKEGYTSSDQIGPVQIVEAGHPLPDERGLRAARRMMDLLAASQADDLILCLISGGGSALLTAPLPDITLEDLQSLTSALLASGARIEEINALRKHLDLLKGGGLARLAAPAQIVALILSDVVGDPLDTIASGPTVPDTTTFDTAYGVLQRYDLLDRAPAPILNHLEQGRLGLIEETPKPGDPVFQLVHNQIIGSNRLAAQAAIKQAAEEGFQPLLLTTYLQGEARQAGRFLSSILRQAAVSGQPVPRPGCIVAGGETTVTLRGGGLGGRNQELALAAAGELAGLKNVALVTLATDGGDGPTDAAGAVVTGETLHRARQLELNPADFLRRNDSYHFFERLGDLLKPGPTQTNVNDLTFLFTFA